MFSILTILTISLIIAQITSAIFIKNGQTPNQKVSLPLNTLLSVTQECPRLQEFGSKLLNDREFCDINLEVNDPNTREKRVFCAHKCILCLRSEVLKKKVKEIVSTRPSKQMLKLPDMNTEVFKNILRFIYTDKIDSDFDLRHNILDLYSIADYLELTELKTMIEEYFYENTRIQDIGNYLEWAKRHRFVKIQKFILDYARNSMKMSSSDWTLFIKNICISSGYTLEESDQLINQINTEN